MWSGDKQRLHLGTPGGNAHTPPTQPESPVQKKSRCLLACDASRPRVTWSPHELRHPQVLTRGPCGDSLSPLPPCPGVLITPSPSSPLPCQQWASPHNLPKSACPPVLHMLDSACTAQPSLSGEIQSSQKRQLPRRLLEALFGFLTGQVHFVRVPLWLSITGGGRGPRLWEGTCGGRDRRGQLRGGLSSCVQVRLQTLTGPVVFIEYLLWESHPQSIHIYKGERQQTGKYMKCSRWRRGTERKVQQGD